MRRRGRVRLVQARSESELVAEAPRLGPPTPDALEAVVQRFGFSGFERGDFVAAGASFGAGLRTDWIALALAHAGAGGLLLRSGLPALRESAVLCGVPVLDVGTALGALDDQEDVIVDFRTGTIESVTRRRVHVTTPMDPDDIATVRAAPALSWYGLADPHADPDVYEPPAPTPVAPRAKGQTTLL